MCACWCRFRSMLDLHVIEYLPEVAAAPSPVLRSPSGELLVGTALDGLLSSASRCPPRVASGDGLM